MLKERVKGLKINLKTRHMWTVSQLLQSHIQKHASLQVRLGRNLLREEFFWSERGNF